MVSIFNSIQESKHPGDPSFDHAQAHRVLDLNVWGKHWQDEKLPGGKEKSDTQSPPHYRKLISVPRRLCPPPSPPYLALQGLGLDHTRQLNLQKWNFTGYSITVICPYPEELSYQIRITNMSRNILSVKYSMQKSSSLLWPGLWILNNWHLGQHFTVGFSSAPNLKFWITCTWILNSSLLSQFKGFYRTLLCPHQCSFICNTQSMSNEHLTRRLGTNSQNHHKANFLKY